MPELWFGVTAKSAYQGPEDSFLNADEESWAKSLLENYEPIKKEFYDYLAVNGMVPYFHQSIINKKDIWKTLGLKFWNIVVHKHQASFPLTYQWLKQNPEVIAFSYSKLEPFGRILPHSGDTNGVYRVHVGIDIPEGLPRCGFRVNDVKRPWQEKKLLTFIDAYEHEAWNETEKSRIIMLIDVIRPEFRKKQSYICKKVIASLILYKLVAVFPVFNHKPEAIPLWLKKVLMFGILMAVYLAIPARNIVAKLRPIK